MLVPELFRLTGGVQVFSRRTIEALDDIYGRPVPVISRNDRRSDCPADFLSNRSFTGCGSLPDGLRRFAIMAASLTKRCPFFFSTHPHFTPWLKLRKKPYLSVAHGIDVWNIEGSKVADGLMSASAILPVSNYTADRLREQLGETIPPIEVFPNTFDANRFSATPSGTPWRDQLDLPTDAQVMLSMCRVSKTESGKGYHRLLLLLPRLIETHPKLYWVLGGKGDDLENVKRIAADLGIADHCRFPGFVPDDTLPDLYRSSDLFVLPSKKEGFGIVFLEAAATGLPVIAGNRDGSVDALADGALGILIDPESDEEIASAIDQVLTTTPRNRQELHDDCTARFGKDAFRNRLARILSNYP
ncbi:glycosyltransferase family 4 protein [Akkermansiaceae bacterium]|nr:glycosyltransferase family 4 protein [Akkermansiaceae bacterium]